MTESKEARWGGRPVTRWYAALRLRIFSYGITLRLHRVNRPPQRKTVAALTLSAAALVGIMLREGYTDKVAIPVKDDGIRHQVANA